MYLRTAMIILWLCTAAWLVRYEAFPEYFTQSLSGYKGLLAKDALLADSWMKIIFHDADIGYSRTSMDINENDASEHYIMENRTHIALNIMGERKNIHALTSIFLDMSYTLKRFTFSFSSPAAVMNVVGVRTEKNTFEITANTGSDNHKTTRIQIPSDVVLYAPFSETAIKHLKPGQQLTIRTIDPISLKKTNLTLCALRREKITITSDEINATVLSSEYHGLKMFTWIDDKGTVLRQESPIGLTMQKCTPEEAYDAALGNNSSDSVLKAILPLLFLTEKNHD